MKKNEKMTITLSAQVAISKTETGMDYVQVMPDHPRAGQTEPFHGMGYGQMLSNGSFDFVRKPRKRRKPALKLPHGSLSFGEDGMDRFVFMLPNEQRSEFAMLLLQESATAMEFIRNAE